MIYFSLSIPFTNYFFILYQVILYQVLNFVFYIFFISSYKESLIFIVIFLSFYNYHSQFCSGNISDRQLHLQIIFSHLFHSFNLLQSQPFLLGDFACKFFLQLSLLQNPDGALVGELLPFTLFQMWVRIGNVDRQGAGPVIALWRESWVLITWE